jgi:hypothetical protein
LAKTLDLYLTDFSGDFKPNRQILHEKYDYPNSDSISRGRCFFGKPSQRCGPAPRRAVIREDPRRRSMQFKIAHP